MVATWMMPARLGLRVISNEMGSCSCLVPPRRHQHHWRWRSDYICARSHVSRRWLVSAKSKICYGNGTLNAAITWLFDIKTAKKMNCCRSNRYVLFARDRPRAIEALKYTGCSSTISLSLLHKQTLCQRVHSSIDIGVGGAQRAAVNSQNT